MASMLRSATERDVVVIEFPRPNEFPLGAVREILSLTEAEIVRLTEVGVVSRSPDGTLSLLTAPFDDRSNPLSAFGDHRRLALPWDETVGLVATLSPGRCAALFVFELTWATDLHDQLLHTGCRSLARRPLPPVSASGR
jgi:hypothetical protein